MIASLPGVRLGYEVSGAGLPVLYLHGFPHDRTLWAAQRSALADRARGIAVDLRGFGDSSTHGPFTMEQYADDVVALLDALGIAQAVVCGLSMGGYVAFALWRRHAERVRALILCDTRAEADSEETRARREAQITLVRGQGAGGLIEPLLTGMVGSETWTRRPEVLTGLRTMMARQSAAGVIGALQALRDRPDSRPTLGTITVPVLVVVGDQDVLTPIADARRIAEALPPAARVRLEVIAGAGHVPCLERPSATTHAIGDFLSTLSS